MLLNSHTTIKYLLTPYKLLLQEYSLKIQPCLTRWHELYITEKWMYKTINIEICVISKGKGFIGIGQSKLQKQRVSYDVI